MLLRETKDVMPWLWLPAVGPFRLLLPFPAAEEHLQPPQPTCHCQSPDSDASRQAKGRGQGRVVPWINSVRGAQWPDLATISGEARSESSSCRHHGRSRPRLLSFIFEASANESRDDFSAGVIEVAVLLISISKQQQRIPAGPEQCLHGGCCLEGRHAQHDTASSKQYESIPWTDYRHREQW